ncbi:MAG: ATP-binding protein [Patescibacteria group bacterium]
MALLLPEVINATLTTKTVIAVIVSVFIVLALDPLKVWIAKATDRFFFKARVDYQKMSSELSEIINREIDLDILLYELTHRLEKDLKIKNVSIYLAGSTGGAFYKRIGRIDVTGHKRSDEEVMKLSEEKLTDIANRIHHDNPLVVYLRQKQDVIVLEALERKIEDTQEEVERKKLESSKLALDQLDAAVVAPVTVGNNLNAVMVVGPKLSGDPFGSEDLNLFGLIGPQLASALEKSRLYEEAQQFTERLKKEVAVATGDLRNANMQLQERNRFLQALQKVTTLISRTLDFEKVTQSVVDSIASELGYLGGVLLLLGTDRHKIFPEAVTRTALTERALKLLPKPLNEYYGYYPDDKSLSVKAIETGKVQISEKLSDFISPAVPAAIAFGIQKLAGIRTVVGVPVYSENEIVGVINFMLQQDHGELKATDVDAMKALAGQTGIVYRNIQLYKQIEESNKHLEVANKHLQQLDQAKSEFVSITSHQLRTPMTGIMGYLSMITQGDFGKVPAEQLKILQGLLEESQRMIRLINLFLNVSKIESGKMTLNRQHMPIDPLIEKVVAMSKKTATDKGLELTYRKPKEPMPEVFADADKLGDVIMNLVDNAIKYTDTGSVTVTSNVDGAYIETTIQDTGRGIDPEEAKKLFTKFVRGFGIAQVNPDGSGLGLYVARRLTEAHDGRIWVESEGKGKGARFHVRIPIYKEGMKEAAEKVESGDVDLTTGG